MRFDRETARIEQQSRQLDPISAHSKSRMNFLQVVCTNQEWWLLRKGRETIFGRATCRLKIGHPDGPMLQWPSSCLTDFFGDLLSATGTLSRKGLRLCNIISIWSDGITKSSTIRTIIRIWPCDSPLTESWPHNRSAVSKTITFLGPSLGDSASFPLIK